MICKDLAKYIYQIDDEGMSIAEMGINDNCPINHIPNAMALCDYDKNESISYDMCEKCWEPNVNIACAKCGKIINDPIDINIPNIEIKSYSEFNQKEKIWNIYDKKECLCNDCYNKLISEIYGWINLKSI
jgi:hypothetical protein